MLTRFVCASRHLPPRCHVSHKATSRGIHGAVCRGRWRHDAVCTFSDDAREPFFPQGVGLQQVRAIERMDALRDQFYIYLFCHAAIPNFVSLRKAKMELSFHRSIAVDASVLLRASMHTFAGTRRHTHARAAHLLNYPPSRQTNFCATGYKQQRELPRQTLEFLCLHRTTSPLRLLRCFLINMSTHTC